MRHPGPAGSAAKRALDVTVAALLLAVAAPVLAVLAWLVRRRLGTPVLFRQLRPGLHGRRFVLYKLRTMTEETDEHGELLPDERRLPPFGRWLRATSLDELPELWNVLKGDMSLVGPRPLLTDYLEHYSPQQARRHEARPGITGLAQVSGRNRLDWEQRLRLDVAYVDNWSLWLDIKILLQTALRVVRREGISHPGHATSPRFDQDAAAGERADPGLGGAGPRTVDRPRALLVAAWDWVLRQYHLPVARELREQGWEVGLVSPDGPHVDHLRDEGFEHIAWAVSRRGLNPVRELAAVRELTAIYRTWGPDTVEHFTIKPIVHGSVAARRAGVPGVINTFTGLGFVFSDRPVARAVRTVIAPVLRRRLRDPDVATVVLNRGDRDRLVGSGLVPAERIVEIPSSGVDVERFRPGDCDRPRDRDVVRFLMAARLLAPKGVMEFADAVGRLHAAGLPVEAVIAGEADRGNPESLAEDALADLGRRPYVRLLGYVEDVAALLRCVDVAVLPTAYPEGVPTFLLEAGATAIPAVGSDIPGCREAIVDGETGVLVPPRDVDSLTGALRRLATDPDLRSKLGTNAREHVVARFADTEVAERHVALHEGLVSR